MKQGQVTGGINVNGTTTRALLELLLLPPRLLQMMGAARLIQYVTIARAALVLHVERLSAMVTGIAAPWCLEVIQTRFHLLPHLLPFPLQHLLIPPRLLLRLLVTTPVTKNSSSAVKCMPFVMIHLAAPISISCAEMLSVTADDTAFLPHGYQAALLSLVCVCLLCLSSQVLSFTLYKLRMNLPCSTVSLSVLRSTCIIRY